MNRVWQFCDELLHAYMNDRAGHQPRIALKVREKGHNEMLSCSYAGGGVLLEAESPLAAIFGLSFLKIATAGECWREFLGDWKPKFPLRTLWICCDLAVPSLDLFCRRVLELGYNSIFLGSQNIDLLGKIDFIHEYGIQVIVKPDCTFTRPSRCPLDPEYGDSLKRCLLESLKNLYKVDYFFWESQCWHHDCLQHPLTRDATQTDLIIKEISLLQEIFEDKPLVYFLPVESIAAARQQAQLFPYFCDSLREKDVLAFPAVGGAFTDDHKPCHPLWQALRKLPDLPASSLMPIVNIGAINQGEGLWPSLPNELIEKYIASVNRHHFGGIACTINKIPDKGTFLDCSLMFAALSMWNKQFSADFIAETWFASERPDLNFARHRDALKKIRGLVIDLSRLRSLQAEIKTKNAEFNQQCRALSETITAQLRCLHLEFEQEEKKRNPHSPHPGFLNYFSHFSADAKGIMKGTGLAV